MVYEVATRSISSRLHSAVGVNVFLLRCFLLIDAICTVVVSSGPRDDDEVGYSSTLSLSNDHCRLYV